MFRVSFTFDLAAGATLNQDFNCDFPTFQTSKGITVELSSKLGGAVLLQLGTIDGATLDPATYVMYGHKRLQDTLDTKTWEQPKFTWNYLSREVQLVVINLSGVADTFYATVTSNDN